MLRHSIPKALSVHLLRFATILLIGLPLAGCDAGGGPPGLPGAGTWRLINYWAVWCEPCREEIPQLNRLNTLPGITVLGVNFDGRTGVELEDDIQALDIEFQILPNDPQALLGTARPQALPTTLIVDEHGNLKHTLMGPQTEEEFLAAMAEAGRQAPTDD